MSQVKIIGKARFRAALQPQLDRLNELTSAPPAKGSSRVATGEVGKLAAENRQLNAERQRLQEQVARREQGQRFLDAFGDQGGVWFAQGKSFDEARVLHANQLAAQNKVTRHRNRVGNVLCQSPGSKKFVQAFENAPAFSSGMN